ncbi:MAG TPA: acetyltransferase [Ferruginibacter sp.]|nr:acetyltransferase [Ferruginibacter sp.]
MIVIGYSGHAFVAIGILSASGKKLTGYCDTAEKAFNPFRLPFLGSETTAENKELIGRTDFFISIGDNSIRKKVYDQFAGIQRYPVNAIHPAAVIDSSVVMGMYGIMVGAGVCINPLAEVRDGAICNTGCIIEHECVVGRFAHIGPGAVLCGNVTVGDGSYVGAGAVVRQGVKIGSQAMIGAGAVVLKDVADGETVVGNPSRILIK